MARRARQNREVYKEQARLLKALANESRLLILDRLKEGECSAGRLVDLVGSDQSTVSKHLAVLRSHGIVDDRREGNQVFYRLLMPCVLSFFGCAERAIEERRRA
jgi:ArsR family transcriptional regulator